MFGSLRLLLALAVALSHAHISWRGHHIGVMAVVVFLLLSGYVVAGLLRPGSALSRSPMRFYAERSARLLPLYYALMLAGALLVLAGGTHSEFLQGPGTAAQWWANLLIVPQNYSMFSQTLEHFLLVPPAWSLGLEIQFYLLAPWLLRGERIMLVAMAATLAISAAAHLGLLHGDWFGYRLLCGNLYIFLSGVWLYRMHHAQASAVPLLGIWGLCLLLFAATGWLGKWGTPFNFEVLLGYLLGLPLVAWLGRQSRKPWDDQLGQLAYGAFLSHFAILWLAPQLGLITPSGRPLISYLALVLAAALVGHVVVERPLLAWRRRLR